MRICLVSAFRSSTFCTGHFLAKTLIGMGHDIVHFDFKKEASIIHDYLKDSSNKIDLLIVWKGSTLDPDIIRSCKFPTVLWYPDDFDTTHGRADYVKFGKVYNHIFTPIEENVVILNRFTIPVKFLPIGVDLSVFNNKNIKYVDYDPYEFSFVGNTYPSIYPERYEVIQKLIEVTKNRWEHGEFFVGQAYTEEYINTIHQSKVNLNVGYKLRGTQLRILEVMASGGFLFTNRCKFVEDNFIDCAGIFDFDNIDGLVEDFIWYVENPDQRKEMIINAFHKMDDHTWEARFRQMFKEIGV